MKFRIVYEARSVGAIGVWQHIYGEFEAEDQSAAFQKFRDAHPDMEFRFPVHCETANLQSGEQS